MKLLIVDDEPDLRNLMGMILEHTFKISVVLAESIKQATEILRANPDIGGIICDFQMPDGTATDLFAFVKTQPRTIQIMVCSGTPIESNPNLNQFPATNFLHKPFTREEILTKVRAVFSL